MSYWYEQKKEDISLSYNKKELHIYLGTEKDLPYADFGNMYACIDIKSLLEVLKENKII